MQNSSPLKNVFAVSAKHIDDPFRYDISFLRIIAVTAVLLYHFNVFPARSGFVGVDIFFVISGFLMTKIILGGFDKNKFSLLQFYNKRLIRIVPALLVLLVLFIFVVYFFIPTQFINYLQSTFSSSLFFSNIYYLMNDGYFSADSHNNFLLHTWSLSVEWQFYMIFPLILLILKKIYLSNKKLFRIVFLVLIGISFLSMLYHNLSDYSYSFYIFYTRAWEMLFGGLALFYARNFEFTSQKVKVILVVFSYLILGFCLVFFNSQQWPSYLTLIPVFFTFLIITLDVNFAILNTKEVKYLGNISYSLYLYHWPIYVTSMFFGVNGGFFNVIGLAFLSLIFAIFSYEFIEKSNFLKNPRLILGFSIMLFVSAFSLTFLDSTIYNQKYGVLTEVTSHYKNEKAPKQFNFETGHFRGERDFKTFIPSNLKVDNNKKNIVLLGDSHAGMFSETIRNLLNNQGFNYIQLTTDSTYPMVNADGAYQGPKEFYNFVFNDFLNKNRDKIDLVVISSNYAAYPAIDLDKMINFTNQYFEKRKIKFLYLGQTENYPIDFPTFFYMKNKYGVTYSGEDNMFHTTQQTNDFLVNKLSSKYINYLNTMLKLIPISFIHTSMIKIT